MSRQPLAGAASAQPAYASLRSNADKCGGLENSSASGSGVASEANRLARRKLLWASACCVVFMVCEIIGGFLANSLAIMTDAAHLLSDLAGFLISIFALWLAMRPATSRMSFGFHRAEILGALLSVLLIWMLTGVLLYEAVQRVQNPVPVNGPIMFLVATGGLIVNFVMGMILRQGNIGHSHGMGAGIAGADDHSHAHGKGSDDSPLAGASAQHSEENLNVKAAFIHVLGDAVQSVGVMIAAGLIWYNPAWSIADPVCTFVFSLLVLYTTTQLIKQSVGVLMEGVPDGIDPDEVEASLRRVPGVQAVHDLHIWSVSVGKPSMSVHLQCQDDASDILVTVNRMCADKYNIKHSTVQIERQRDTVDCNVPTNLDKVAVQSFSDLGIAPLRTRF